MSDILDAVPIDKYFSLFRPGAGGDGGFIRLSLDFGPEPPKYGGYENGGGRRRGKGWLLPLLLLVAAGVAGGVAGKRWYDERQEKGGSGGKGAKGGSGKPAAKKK